MRTSNKTRLVVTCLMMFALLLSHNMVYTFSSMPPPAVTGAPGEMNCTQCHGGSAANSGSGSVSINFANADNLYEAGMTYDMSVTINDDSAIRAGFQLVALDDDGNNIGAFTADGNTTTITSDGGKDYISHKNVGNPGDKTFAFTWTAPETSEGTNITFYTSALAGNGNNENSGDRIYTSSLVIQLMIASIQNTSVFKAVSVYPNPVDEQLKLDFTLGQSDELSINLLTLDGKLVRSLYEGSQIAGQHSLHFDVSDIQYRNGLYLIHLQTSTSNWSQKVLFQ